MTGADACKYSFAEQAVSLGFTNYPVGNSSWPIKVYLYSHVIECIELIVEKEVNFLNIKIIYIYCHIYITHDLYLSEDWIKYFLPFSLTAIFYPLLMVLSSKEPNGLAVYIE